MQARYQVGLLLALAAPPAAWSLEFAACTESGHGPFDCATVTVPLDRAGGVPGTIDLAVERLRQEGPALPVLIALAGGPGQSATAFASTFATIFEQALDRYQLVVMDQRGTGRSGALDCPALRASYSRETIAQCGQTIGPAGRFYTTADSVLDLDAVRAELGVERLVVAGVSYGTHVALEYARTFPDRAAAVVLDSTLPPDGLGGLGEEAFGAVRRVLGELCRDGGCAAFTRDPVVDTAALVRRLVRPLRGVVIDADGRRRRGKLDSAGLFRVLRAGDLRPVLHARYPGAVVAARRGDAAPLLRLQQLVALSSRGAGAEIDPALRLESVALNLATACSDTRFPWEETHPPELRAAALDLAARTLPAAVLFPFDHRAAYGSGVATSCIYWPTTSLARASSPSPIPDLPALILAGTRDVRTPIENAEHVAALLPHAVRVVVPNRGHSLLTGPDCARTALTAFLHDGPVGDPCAALAARFRPESPPPRTLGRARPLRAVPGLRGRALRVVVDTLNDAVRSALTVSAGVGAPVQVGGLRAGRATGTIDSRTFHLELQRYTIVPGVAVSGTIDFDGNGTTASARVRGPVAGLLRFDADGSVRGRLDGRPVVLAGSRQLARTSARVRAQSAELPPIP